MRLAKTLVIGSFFILLPTGCTGKFNPFTDENHFDTVLGYPPKALARFLDIESQLTVDPEDLNKAKPRY